MQNQKCRESKHAIPKFLEQNLKSQKLRKKADLTIRHTVWLARPGGKRAGVEGEAEGGGPPNTRRQRRAGRARRTRACDGPTAPEAGPPSGARPPCCVLSRRRGRRNPDAAIGRSDRTQTEAQLRALIASDADFRTRDIFADARGAAISPGRPRSRAAPWRGAERGRVQGVKRRTSKTKSQTVSAIRPSSARPSVLLTSDPLAPSAAPCCWCCPS